MTDINTQLTTAANQAAAGNPWDNDPSVSPLDVALILENTSPHVASVARSIYQQESGSGADTKTSNAGAVGGMQVIPATFNAVADKGWDIHDPVDNARAGVRYLTQMADKAGGDPALTAAGYYGGPGAIEKARQGIAVADPRNSSAPNTLQYGQQVAARITQDQESPWDSDPVVSPVQAGVNGVGMGSSQVSQGNPWDNDPIVGSPPGASTGPQTETQAVPQATPQPASQSVQDQQPSTAAALWQAVTNPRQTLSNIEAAVSDTVSDAGHRALTQPVGKTLDDAVRGIANGLTFGFADKAAGVMDSLFNNRTVAQNTADERQQTKDGGGVTALGNVGGQFLQGPAIGAAAGLEGGAAGLAGIAAKSVPTTSMIIRASAGAAGGAAEGALNYSGHDDGPVNGNDLTASSIIGAALGPLGAVGGPTVEQRAAQFLTNAGGDAATAMQKAAIAQDFGALQSRGTQGGAKLGIADAVALANKYASDAGRSIDTLASTGAIDQDTAQQLQGALRNGQALNDVQLNDIRAMPNVPQGVGDAVADAIQKRQTLNAMTQARPETWSVARTALSHAVGQGVGAAVGLPVIGGFIAQPIVRKMMSGGATEAENIASMAKQAQNAQAFLGRQAAQGVQVPTGLSQLAQQATQAQAARQTQVAALAARQILTQQAQTNTLRAATRMPIGGGFQTLLQGGQSGLNLTSKDANQGLRVLANHPTLGPISDEMRQTGMVTNPTNFYALQNGLRGLKEQGAIGQMNRVAAPVTGASAMSAAISNPTSYAAAVQRNQAMVSHAASQAPTPALAMIANQLGSTSDPAVRQVVLAAVLKGAKDPVTQRYVRTYLQPLVKYGK